MNINVVRTLPQKLYVAFSGGVDSVVMAHKAISQNKDVTLAFFHHGNEIADAEQEFSTKFAEKYNLRIEISKCPKTAYVGSKEKVWRDLRYEFFKQINAKVATGHNLDDAVEWYLLTCLRGEGHYMEYTHANVIRPLLLTRKDFILEYAKEHNLEWFEDPTNIDTEFTYRNKIRHKIVPLCMEINPGLHTTVANVIREKISLYGL